jgi:hypothetical protein
LQPTFLDPIVESKPAVRNLTLAELEKDVNRLRSITDREYGHTERMRRPVAHTTVTPGQMQQAIASRLVQTYEPPGTLREGGPRHDNDSTDIRDIRIAPTHDELLCPVTPYLPVFHSMAPHHLPENSMERHLDIQFRLLREEMMYAHPLFYCLLALIVVKYFRPAIDWRNPSRSREYVVSKKPAIGETCYVVGEITGV